MLLTLSQLSSPLDLIFKTKVPYKLWQSMWDQAEQQGEKVKYVYLKGVTLGSTDRVQQP